MLLNIYSTDCVDFLKNYNSQSIDLTFLDPPFNQDKDYSGHDDNLDPEIYWRWMETISNLLFLHTSSGGAIYFMQREKNVSRVIETLNKTGWSYQNLIIWKKKTSAVPGVMRFGKHYQVIAFFTKGTKPRVFNKLRIDPPLQPNERIPRESGVFLTDVWDDIRELTSGYFAGEEAIRNVDGSRFHKQQAPLKLLTRIILSSSMPGDLVFDPFAGTGTTLVAATQLEREILGIDINQKNVDLMIARVSDIRPADSIRKLRADYKFTDNLDVIWQNKEFQEKTTGRYRAHQELNLFTN